MAVAAGGESAHELPVPHDRLVVVEEWLGICQAELQEASAQTLILLAADGVAADEVFLT